jgi:RNA polymerase sigma factor (sigma-70 family)
MDEDLRDLIARIRHGDRRGLDEFARAYGGLIRRLAHQRIVRMRMQLETEPDEILDATILELCRRAEQISAIEPGEFLSYLQRVVHSQVNEVWRRARSDKRGSRWRTDLGHLKLELADAGASPSEELELNEALSRTYEQLDGLERTICMLRRSGCPWDEIAVRLGTSADTVRKRWKRAVVRVLRWMG